MISILFQMISILFHMISILFQMISILFEITSGSGFNTTDGFNPRDFIDFK